MLGTDLAHPGEGVGSALVRHVLHDRANASEPAYPETESEANVPLHERRGFGVVGDLDVPGGGPHLWLMWTRPPGALLTDALVAMRRVSRRLSNPAARWVTPTTHSTERVVDWPAATAQAVLMRTTDGSLARARGAVLYGEAPAVVPRFGACDMYAV